MLHLATVTDGTGAAAGRPGPAEADSAGTLRRTRSTRSTVEREGATVELAHEFTLHASLGDTLQMGGGPFGARVVTTVTGGWVKGSRLNGRVVGPGADWAILGADGFAHLDVRAQVRTDDGADLFVHYTGSLELTDATMAALLGDGETEFVDQYFRSHVRVESGDERYGWVNRALFVGEGRIASDGVEYEVYRLA
jgi:hypothetical protein